MMNHPVRSCAQSDFDVSYAEELRSTVAQILDSELTYKDESQEWLQKWWAVRVRDLIEIADAAYAFKEEFFRAALEARTCCFCGPLKRGYIHDDKCAFVDFVNVPAVTHLKGK